MYFSAFVVLLVQYFLQTHFQYKMVFNVCVHYFIVLLKLSRVSKLSVTIVVAGICMRIDKCVCYVADIICTVYITISNMMMLWSLLIVIML